MGPVLVNHHTPPFGGPPGLSNDQHMIPPFHGEAGLGKDRSRSEIKLTNFLLQFFLAEIIIL